jgi:hypothetical protein
MKIWSNGQISSDEKADILGKHRHIYNGYKTMHPDVSNSQPLYVQDFANDKDGLVVNNRGEVMKYTNVGINESVKEEKYESECMECGVKEEDMESNNVEDINLDNEFDYTEEMDEEFDESYFDDVDEDLKESLISQRDKIMEVFNKFKRYN